MFVTTVLADELDVEDEIKCFRSSWEWIRSKQLMVTWWSEVN